MDTKPHNWKLFIKPHAYIFIVLCECRLSDSLGGF